MCPDGSVPTNGECLNEPDCEVEAGQSLGAMVMSDYGKTAACVNHCAASAAMMLSVGLYDGSGQATAYYWQSTGANCAPVESTAVDVGCADQVVEHLSITVTGCSFTSDAGGVSDGTYVDQETEETKYSGTSWENALNTNGGCVATQNGGMFCVSTAPALDRPKDENGATVSPDVVMTQHAPYGGSGGETTSWDYYSPATLSGTCGGVGQSACDGGGSTGGETTGGTTGGECDPETTDCTGGEGGGYSSSCEQPPSCEKDGSVYCAILRQQWKDTCRTLDISKQDVGLALTAAGLGGGMTDGQYLDQIKEEVNVLDKLQLQIVGMSGAACPAPATFQFMGETYEWSWEPLCDFLRWMGVFVVVGSTLAAIKIAFGI